MDYTQNLHLPQWEETDRILRTDFNGAMEAIDTGVKAVNDAVTTLGTTKATAASVTALAGRVSAVESGKADSTSVNAALAQKADASALTALQGAMPKIATGNWTGDGAATRTISVGFTPKFVLVFGSCYSGSERDLEIIMFPGKTRCFYHVNTNNYSVATTLGIVNGGFTVNSQYGNYADYSFFYFAIG